MDNLQVVKKKVGLFHVGHQWRDKQMFIVGFGLIGMFGLGTYFGMLLERKKAVRRQMEEAHGQ